MLSMDPNICFFALRNRIELQCLIIIFSHFYIIIIIIIIINKYHYHSPQPSKIISRKQTSLGAAFELFSLMASIDVRVKWPLCFLVFAYYAIVVLTML